MFCCNDAFKYKYNGKELQDELGFNTYAYGWRDYDPTIGRFLKIDRFAEKYSDMTPYGYAGNNPMLYVDIQGDSLKVANTQITKDYLNDAVRNKNQQYIKYDDDGNVSLDFGDMNKKDIAKTLKRDSGLSAINDLVNSKDSEGKSENYYMEVSNNREGVLDGNQFTLSFSKLEGTTTGNNDNRFMLSLSTTKRGDGLPQINPPNGYSGALYLSPGTLLDYDPVIKTQLAVPRSEFVKHELREMYLRTHNKMTYPEAHKNAGGHPTYTGFKYD